MKTIFPPMKYLFPVFVVTSLCHCVSCACFFPCVWWTIEYLEFVFCLNVFHRLVSPSPHCILRLALSFIFLFFLTPRRRHCDEIWIYIPIYKRWNQCKIPTILPTAVSFCLFYFQMFSLGQKAKRRESVLCLYYFQRSYINPCHTVRIIWTGRCSFYRPEAFTIVGRVYIYLYI